MIEQRDIDFTEVVCFNRIHIFLQRSQNCDHAVLMHKTYDQQFMF